MDHHTGTDNRRVASPLDADAGRQAGSNEHTRGRKIVSSFRMAFIDCEIYCDRS